MLNKIKRPLTYLLSFVFALCLIGGFSLDLQAKPGKGKKSHRSHTHKSKDKHYKKGPPDHAPAHGYRRKQKANYIYYPDHRVVYIPAINRYAWQIIKDGKTVIEYGAKLPSTIKLVGSGVNGTREFDTNDSGDINLSLVNFSLF